MRERLDIRGRILSRFAAHCEIEDEGPDGEPAFSIDRDALLRIVESEFGVTVPVELIPESFTIDWLVEMVEELSDDAPYVM